MKTFKNNHISVEKKITAVSQYMRHTMLNTTLILIVVFLLVYSTSSCSVYIAEPGSEK